MNRMIDARFDITERDRVMINYRVLLENKFRHEAEAERKMQIKQFRKSFLEAFFSYMLLIVFILFAVFVWPVIYN